ncbi:ABC transporter ATP-binding protein [bacterium]|nr:ABC transporter ATP-binding protein [bacterium]
MDRTIIKVQQVKKRFRTLEVLKGLDLEVCQGSIYGFLGRNGVGKTTTVRILLGLDDIFEGTVRVFELDPRTNGDRIRLRTGYVPETPRFPEWMKIEQLLTFTAPFYPTWDRVYADELLTQFQLPRDRKIKQLSRGMLAKVALTMALAHRPKLLVLDDPTMGLDAVVRREFLEQIVDIIREGDRTVFLTSHIIDEVERVADHIGIMTQGILVESCPLEELKQRNKTIVARFIGEPPVPAAFPDQYECIRNGNQLQFHTRHFSEEVLDFVKSLEPHQLEVHDLSLEDIFVRYVGPQVGDVCP